MLTIWRFSWNRCCRFGRRFSLRPSSLGLELTLVGLSKLDVVEGHEAASVVALNRLKFNLKHLIGLFKQNLIL